MVSPSTSRVVDSLAPTAATNVPGRSHEPSSTGVLGHGPGGWASDWREPYFLGELERLGIPYVLSRLPLERDMQASGRALEEYFVTEGLGKRHYALFVHE